MKSLKNLLVLEVCIIAVFYVTLSTVTGQLTEQGYGQSCEIVNGSHNCSPSNTLGLNCSGAVGGVCICKSGRHWVPDKGMCVAEVNEECLKRPTNGSQPVYCTQNASCLMSSNGTEKCFCNFGFSNSIGECMATLGGPCASESFCNQYEYLTCNTNHTCACRPGDIENGGECKVPIKGDCSTNLKPPRVCMGAAHGATCSNNSICECPAGSVPTPDNFDCVKGYNLTCDSQSETEHCGETLTCVANVATPTPATTSTPLTTLSTPTNATTPAVRAFMHFEEVMASSVIAANDGVCGCKSIEKFNTTTSRCQILAAQPCNTETEPLKLCVVNSACSAQGVCDCDVNFTPSSEGKCLGGLNTDCTHDNDLCNGGEYLTCGPTSKRCECKQSYTWSNATNACVGPKGSSCTRNENCDMRTSECRESTCQCKAGFVPNGANTDCVGSLDALCPQGVLCAENTFLQCVGGACKCGSATSIDQFFNSTLGQCQVKVGGSCALTPAGNISCTTNSTCSESSTCDCIPSFKLNETTQTCESGGAGIYIASVAVILSVLLSVLM